MNHLLAGAALIAAATLWIPPAAAQIANLPADVRAKIAAMGPVLDLDLVAKTMALFQPLALPEKMRAGIKVVADVSYGADVRNKLDVYYLHGKLDDIYPPTGQQRPILIYIPGGGFIGGDKHSNDAVYANVAVYFARHGMVAINANYRLAPQHPWPAGAEDVGKVVAWAKANAAKYGGDPDRIYLMGHSAGATHVASYVFDATLHPKDGTGVVAAILVSGFYEVVTRNLIPNVSAYFGEDASQYPARSPITHVGESKVPLLIAVAEYDPPFLETPSLNLAAKVCDRDGKCPRFAWLKGHNHMSEIASINTRDQEFGRTVLDFIHPTR